MNYEEALNYIYTRGRGEHPAGLTAMRELCRRLGDPQAKCRFFHVAGTNGKGSVTAVAAEIFKAAGYRTGRYVSPYVIEFRERIMVNGEMASKEQIAQYVSAIKAASNGLEPSFFEVVTAAAFLHFAAEKCDIVCLETGLGGRLDATNIIEDPAVSVITRIGMDHQAILGDTIEKITAEKCGIIRPGGTVVTYPTQRAAALGVIFEKAAEKNARVILPSMSSVTAEECGVFGSTVIVDGRKYRLPLGGAHQVKNLVTALAAIDAAGKNGFPLTAEARQRGVAAVRFPARLEVFRRDPLVLLDGAHNLDGAQSLYDALRTLPPETKLFGVAGMVQDKPYRECMELLAPLFETVFTAAPRTPRAVPADLLAKQCENAVAAEGPEDAVKAAFAAAGDTGAVVVFGSLYLAGDVRETLIELTEIPNML